MNIHFSGGAMEIGGSCIYINIAGKRILLDCGIRQSSGRDPLPDFAAIQERGGLDAVIVSHAHMDHTGTLPIISKAYPDARIYMTVMTADLTRVLLYDSLKIMNGREDEIPHYTEQDVLAMLNRITPVRFQQPVQLFDNFTLTFYPAGHIAGAACIYLTTEEGCLFYSGDFSAFSQRTIEGIHIPKLRPDVAIVETTYGTRLHANRQVEEKRLVSLAAECIRNGQKILIPAFALGRAQEVLLILRAAIQNQEIPPVPVYVDGMVRDINAMYTRNPTFLKNSLARRIMKGNEPFYTKEIQAVAPRQDRDALLSGKDPVIIVSSSGMLTGGPSAQYARRLVSSENACIIITGYQDEESPGRRLLDLLDDSADPGNPERKLTLDGVSYPVRCRVEQVGLSAHGDRSEIEALLERVSSRHVFLVHGNADVIEELGKELAAQDYRRRIYLPECGQDFEIRLRAKRKQLSFTPSFTMQKTEPFTDESAALLWAYWREHYPGRRFPVSTAAQIWYGKEADEDALRKMQEVLLSSPYFSPNARQLFLFEPNSEEDVREALTPKELTVQDLDAAAASVFSGFPYRKAGYHTDTKEVVLSFDYPDALDREGFQERADAFREKTGWTAQINPSMNHSLAGSLLQTLFPGRIRKSSYYLDRKCYSVSLSSESDEDGKSAVKFRGTTGWELILNGKSFDQDGRPAAPGHEDASAPTGNQSAPSPTDSGPGQPLTDSRLPGAGSAAEDAGSKAVEFLPARDTQPLEQNLALSCISREFTGLPFAPEKKSLKQDAKGRYIELSFISPAVGQRFAEQIQRAADQTGWRLRISDKINQIALIQTAQSLCMESGITLKKTPSYMPLERAVVLKTVGEVAQDAADAVEKKFQEQTGCICRVSAI